MTARQHLHQGGQEFLIAEKGLSIETIQVDLRSGEHLTPEFKEINPFFTVPVLELDDGTRLKSTAGIWNYLESF